jgi:outer membrane protein assembly factor BamB
MIRTALDEFGDRTRIADLNVLMAVAYSRAGQGLRARLIAGRVLRTHPNGKLTLLKREQTYEELLRPLIAKAAGADLQETLPRLPAALTEIWSRPWPQPGGFTRLPPQPPTGGRVYAMEISRSSLELVALDVKTGNPAWKQQTNVTLSGTAIRRTPNGTLFALNQGFALLDDEGGERWSVATGGPPTAVSLHAGMLVYCTRLFNTRRSKSLLRVSALDAASGGEVWQQETELEGTNAQWIGHSATGIYLLVFGQDTRLVLLSPESGDVRATAVIPMDGRTGATPVVSGEHVLVPDRLGRLHAFDIETLKEAGVHESRVTYPGTLELRGDQLIIVGNNSAAAYSLLDNSVQWRVGLPVSEALTGNRVLKDVLVLATRSSNGQGKVYGYRLKDGKPAFNYTLERENDNDRIDLGADAVFDDGFAAVYIEQRIVDGRLRLWGFRLIVLNADGTERLSWNYRAQNNAAYVQLAVTEDCLVVALDQSVTVGFGAK